MKNGSALIIVVFLILLTAASFWKYKVYVLERDFTIDSQVSCDVETESCFVQICEDDDCEIEPYKKISINAGDLPICDEYSEEDCPEPVCPADSQNCMVSFCTSENLEEGEECYIHEPIDSAEVSSTNET
jgi:hypothetical protein